MKYIKYFIVMNMAIFLFGCGQGNLIVMDIEELDKPGSVVSAATPSFLSFTWIEKGFNGIFFPTDQALGESQTDVLESLGEPNEKGLYEGGNYYTYDRTTYIFSSENYLLEAIMMDISDYRVSVEEMKRALGTPDRSELDELDGYWTYSYELDDYTLFFETSEEGSPLEFVWLVESEKQ
ncbi:hypothetical protein BTR22_00200 [Alkalihalophilus pseudofirmus]|uniref:DUF4309 domain-containing protein n=1 Tax=Alkalihalophilus pseudofirmus TaxID=79885 RepID=UPI000950E0D6|nr:hypothetical protein BTR22_00200 [Alkalihalophilus pseudofirmus]